MADPTDPYVTRPDFEAANGGPVDDETWTRTLGLLRRAARELTLLVGDLSQFDPTLVSDTLIDAVLVSGTVDNPSGFRSESDGDYAYTRYDRPNGAGRSRFWWPWDLWGLFGVPHFAGGKIRSHKLSPSNSYMGWIR